jgi:sterol desaturase/sphingolipid hydroxylase (fatty acid hydroxylase superfamily)
MRRALVRTRAFVTANGTALGVGLLTHRVAGRGGAARAVLAALVRVALLTAVISRSAASKPAIGGARRVKGPTAAHTRGLLARAAVAACIEALAGLLARPLLARRAPPSGGHTAGAVSALRALAWFARFVAKSFAYELVFDLLHYWAHRALHHSPALYALHKSHHRFLHPSPLSTFQQDPADLLVSNVAPSLAALALLGRAGLRFDPLEFSVLESYKAFVEIAGHAGIETHATSFPQCQALPKALGIALRTNDHDLHHSQPTRPCNFSKRFVLWDKVFGTYRADALGEAEDMDAHGGAAA